MNMSPVVSVVTPFDGRLGFLKETIQSVSDQTYGAWQHILINDGEKEISEPLSKHVKVINRARLPKGASTCRNIGVNEAVGEYIIFLDSDDILSYYCLEQRVKVMEMNPHLDFAVFPMLIFSNSPSDGKFLWNKRTEEEDILRFLRLDAVWQTSGPIWRKSSLQRIGGFNEELKCWQDLDLHLKALFAGLSYQVYESQPDCYYRRHSAGSISQGRINTPEKLASRLQLFDYAYDQIQLFNGDRRELHSNVRIMLKSILMSALKIRNNRFFWKAYLRRQTLKTLTLRDILMLEFLFVAFNLKLYKFHALKNFINRIYKMHIIQCTIGKIAAYNISHYTSKK